MEGCCAAVRAAVPLLRAKSPLVGMPLTVAVSGWCRCNEPVLRLRPAGARTAIFVLEQSSCSFIMCVFPHAKLGKCSLLQKPFYIKSPQIAMPPPAAGGGIAEGYMGVGFLCRMVGAVRGQALVVAGEVHLDKHHRADGHAYHVGGCGAVDGQHLSQRADDEGRCELAEVEGGR